MSPDTDWPWSVLGLPDMPEGPKDVRRAYARALKAIDPSRDIDGFTGLRRAYEQALAIVEGGNAPTQPLPPPAPQADAPARRVDILLARLGRDAVMIGPLTQITDVLADPLVHDPEHHVAFRRQTAKLIHANYYWPTEVPGYFTYLITPATLLALDDAFGWLTDFAAFHRDFGTDLDLFDTMIREAVAVPPREQSDANSPLRAAAAESLTRHIASAATGVPVNFRIARALSSPLINEPNYAPALRAAIVQVLKQDFHGKPRAGQLSDSIDQNLLIRLQTKFGWPSKRAAFLRDFGRDTALLNALRRRSRGLKIPSTPEGWLWLWLLEYVTYAGFVGLSIILVGALMFGGKPDSQKVGQALASLVVLPGVVFLFTLPCMLLLRGGRRLRAQLARAFSGLRRLIRR